MEEFKCPFTNQIINKDSIKRVYRNYQYSVNVNNLNCYLTICKSFYRQLIDNDNEVLKDFESNKPIIVYAWLNGNLRKWEHLSIHWNCPEMEGALILEKILPELKEKVRFPKNRKQKADNFLMYLKENQGQDGGSVQISENVWIWGNLFFKNYEELVFYIEELESKNLVNFDKQKKLIRLTFNGLDSVENLLEMRKGNENEFFGPEFEIGLSFAGEERSFVEQVAEELRKRKVKVFYDIYEQADLWGKNLYQHLNSIYKDKCKFCIVFLSKNYAKKMWTRHELEAAQARAFKENEEYILPVKFDDTEIPGINTTTGYLDASNFSPKQIAIMAIEKLNSVN